MEVGSDGQNWLEVLEALPFVVAVLDADGRYMLLNRASRADPLLAHGHLGETDLSCCSNEPELQQRARARHRYYQHSLLTKEPLLFEEETAGTGAVRGGYRWVCIPFWKQGEARLIVVGIGSNDAGCASASSAATRQLLGKINNEVRAPLAALVGVAGALVHELSGAQQARASLIDQSGQQVLRQLSILMQEAEKPPLPSASQ